MISPKPEETVEGMTQAILDIRRAAWLGAREEVNPDELGIFGINLGGITALPPLLNRDSRMSACCWPAETSARS
jgi:hypothetical protein